MRMLDVWTDDHLPCFSFEHEGKKFSINWSDRSIIGRIEMIGEGDITIEKALKKYKGLLAVIKNPLNATFASPEEGEPEDEDCWDEGCAQYQTDVGYLTVEPYTD